MNSHGQWDDAVAGIMKEIKRRLIIDFHVAQAKNPRVTTPPLLGIISRSSGSLHRRTLGRARHRHRNGVCLDI